MSDANHPAGCHHVLRVAAAAGQTFALHEVARLLQRPVASLLPDIDEALALGLITPQGNDFAFRDTEVWRSILAAIPKPVLYSLRMELSPASRADGWEELNPTERSIARLAGEGLTNQQISRHVYLSPHTVNYYLRRIFRKLNLHSRVELARRIPADELTLLA